MIKKLRSLISRRDELIPHGATEDNTIDLSDMDESIQAEGRGR